jgi:Fe2+ or Zn2+ uptake regulation protein
VGDHVHLTAEQVHDLARERLPEISRATVYNTLNELVAMGELLVVDVVDGPKRYDPNVAVSHDHLVCDRCHAIRDVPREAPPPPLPEEAAGGFLVTGTEVTYRGLCPRCLGRDRGTGRGGGAARGAGAAREGRAATGAGRAQRGTRGRVEPWA